MGLWPKLWYIGFALPVEIRHIPVGLNRGNYSQPFWRKRVLLSTRILPEGGVRHPTPPLVTSFDIGSPGRLTADFEATF